MLTFLLAATLAAAPAPAPAASCAVRLKTAEDARRTSPR